MFCKIVVVLKGVLFFFFFFLQISLENNCARYNVNIKVCPYAFILHFNLKKIPAHNCFPVSSAKFLRRPFFSNIPGQVLLASYSTYN